MPLFRLRRRCKSTPTTTTPSPSPCSPACSSSAACSASRKLSSKLLRQSNSALSVFPPLSLSLSSSLAHSAVSSSSSSAQTFGISWTSTTPSRTPWPWPSESSTLELSGRQMKGRHGFSLLSQVSSLKFEFLLYMFPCSYCQHDPDQHDDGDHQHGL